MPGFAFRTVATTLFDRIAALRGRVRQSARRARTVVEKAQREAERTARGRGLSRRAPTLDMNAPEPGMLQRAARAALALVALSLLGGSTMAFFLFLVQLFAAALLVTRGLGIHVDLAPRRAS